MTEKKTATVFVKGLDRGLIKAAKEKARRAGVIWRAWVEQAITEKLDRQ